MPLDRFDIFCVVVERGGSTDARETICVVDVLCFFFSDFNSKLLTILPQVCYKVKEEYKYMYEI